MLMSRNRPPHLFSAPSKFKWEFPLSFFFTGTTTLWNRFAYEHSLNTLILMSSNQEPNFIYPFLHNTKFLSQTFPFISHISFIITNLDCNPLTRRNLLGDIYKRKFRRKILNYYYLNYYWYQYTHCNQHTCYWNRIRITGVFGVLWSTSCLRE